MTTICYHSYKIVKFIRRNLPLVWSLPRSVLIISPLESSSADFVLFFSIFWSSKKRLTGDLIDVFASTIAIEDPCLVNSSAITLHTSLLCSGTYHIITSHVSIKFLNVCLQLSTSLEQIIRLPMVLKAT